MKVFIVATTVSALLLAGCATADDPVTASNAVPSTATATATATSASGQADALLATHGLAGKNTVELIDHLDRLSVAERPTALKASVRPHELVISSGAQEYQLDIPDGQFYLSVAPYANQTHQCFYHSLTTCKGELADQDVQVKIVDETNSKVLVDEVRTTFDNGFVGLWLPQGITATLRITHDGKTGQTKIATGEQAPTCLTTLRLT
ncbi:CueP family metal-binding protein [Actinoplanes sp. NBC_00393]|uniref:CueP family metal-binding protein n=1 Tax=Actinoplanes sp. NBC_00393 TaxID=2975953 RepID=UPI002E1BB43C